MVWQLRRGMFRAFSLESQASDSASLISTTYNTRRPVAGHEVNSTERVRLDICLLFGDCACSCVVSARLKAEAALTPDGGLHVPANRPVQSLAGIVGHSGRPIL
jgi:hypothetical protein